MLLPRVGTHSEPPVPNSIFMLLTRRHTVTRLPGAGMIGVSMVGALSEKTTTLNNGPETIASGLNNNEQRVPAAARVRIPSPKSWSSYIFWNRINKEPTGPSRQSNEEWGQKRTPVQNNGGPPSGGSSPSSNGNNAGQGGNSLPGNWYIFL